MKTSLKHIIILFALFLTSNILFSNVQARTLILVHGFMADSSSWGESGFTKPLEIAGWKYGGGYGYNQWGMMAPRSLMTKGDIFFSVELPSKANLQIQEGLLLQYLQHLYSKRKESVTLVGHSAGGLVARLYVLDPKHQPVNALITIATPHLGTPAANIAHLAGNSPIGMMASMAGVGSLQDSRGLFSDLKEEKPNNFLYWMNRQSHPNIHYASIIRKNQISSPSQFDFVVPTNSQNMNNIWALKKRSGVALSSESHSISATDGRILLDILKHIK